MFIEGVKGVKMSSDFKIIKKLKSRSSSTFEKVYYQYKNLIFYHAYSIVNNKEDADDITQNTFIKLMQNIDLIDENSSLKALLSKIAINEAIDVYRKNASRKEVYNEELLNNQKDESSNDENFNVIISLNNTLENTEAKIVSLKIVYDYSFSEIAEELDLTIGMVQAKYYKAIKQLKQHYSRRS